MKISNLVILSESKRNSLTLFKFMTEHAGVPATNAVSEFCSSLEKLMQEKGWDVLHLGESIMAESIEAVRKYPNTISKLGYPVKPLWDSDLPRAMRNDPRISGIDDESASVVTLQNGSKLVFDFIDYEIIPIGSHA